MKYQKPISLLVLLIVAGAIAATLMGIFSNDGAGPYAYQSIRGKTVMVYGNGLYKHMSAEVAPQGIAQDYVTLFAGVPLLVLSLLWARKGALRGRYLLCGTLGYFLVTYLFYTVMGMYNALFLVYVALLGAAFYAFLLTLLSFDVPSLRAAFAAATPYKVTGRFLVLVAAAIALLWLSIVVPPLLNGTIIPVQTEHYTTLIVQGLDLGLLLPAAVISGVLWQQKATLGYLLAPVYFIFLSLLMTALTAKVVAMALLDYNVWPVIFIIPTFNVLTIGCAATILKHLNAPFPVINKATYEKTSYA